MYPNVIDNSFLFLMVGLSIAALAFAMLVRFHPVFFIFFFIILIIIIVLAGVMSNIYLEMANNENLSEQAAQLTFITNIMGKLPFIIGVMGFILSMVMYKTWRADL